MKTALTIWLVLALATLAPAASAAPQARIYGGANVADIADVPFQAALVRSGAGAYAGQFCGGSIRDDRHVITAAHCVYDNPYTAPGQAMTPAAVDVLVGTTNLATPGPSAQRVPVSEVSFDPRYYSSPFAYDAAVLTLATALDLTNPPVQAATRVTSPEWSATPPTTLLWVSGWGKMDGAAYPTALRETQVPLHADASCQAVWGGIIDGPIMVCAGDGVRDSCSGDSGGPLSVDVDPLATRVLHLAGIVSFGPASGCADPVLPGVYTQIDGPVRAYVEALTPTPAPRAASAATITGAARVGDVLTCSPGTWTGSPAFSYRFARGATPVRGPGADASYTVQSADAGATISCEVKATNAGGYGLLVSAPSALVPRPDLAVTSPATTTTTEPAAPPRPPVTPRPTDRTAPVARIAKLACRGSRCMLDARVTDAGFSSGLRRVEVKLVSKYRTRCTRGKRRVPCTRIRARALRAASLATTGYRVRVTGLPAGRHTFTLRAVDVAGNRQAIPARRTVRTR